MKRLARKEQRYEREQLLLRKDFSSERRVMEEVFDKSTLMIVYRFLNKGVIDEIYGTVKAGKEARVYWGKDKDGNELAIKIYLTVASEFKKGKLRYIEGDPRFTHVKRDTRSLVYAWALKEYKNLHLALKAKVRVPRPIALEGNVLVMKFIGKNGNPALKLKDNPPKKPRLVYDALLEFVKRLYTKVELVHGDLSEYNVMMWRNKPVLFDMAQSVLLSHPMASMFLKRDLVKLHRYFKKLGVEVLSPEEIYRTIVEDDAT